MIGLAGVLRTLKTLIGIGETAKEVIGLVDEVIDPEPRVKGQPLSYLDVEHQRRQAQSGARAFPAPVLLPPPSLTPVPTPLPPTEPSRPLPPPPKMPVPPKPAPSRKSRRR